MADLLGRRRLFMAGLALFTIASLACGFANTNNLLIAARAVQGLGGAMIAPAALSILSTTFAEGEERNKALASGAPSRARRRGGRPARRRAHRVRRLGVGLLRQRADRPRGDPARPAPAAREPRRGCRPLVRRDRRDPRHREPLAARLHRRQDRRVPLVLGPHARLLRDLGRPMAAFLLNEQRAAEPAAAALDLPAADDRRGQRRRVHARRGDLRDVLPARPLHAGPAGSATAPIRSGLGYLLVACTIIVSAGASQALVGGSACGRCCWPASSCSRSGCCSSRASPRTAATSAISRRASSSRASASASRSSRSRSPRSWASATTSPGSRRAHQHVAADRRRRRRGAARDGVHEPHGRPDPRRRRAGRRLHRRPLARVPRRRADVGARRSPRRSC